MLHCVKVANPAGLVPLPPIEGVRLAAGGAKHPPRGFRGIPPDTPLVTFVVKRKSPGVRGGAPAQGESRGATPLAYSGYAGALPLLQLPRGAAVPLYLYPEKPQKLHPTVQPNRKKNKKNRRPSQPVWGRASLHVASDDTSACSVKRNMRSGKNNCPAALENCQEICYNY